MGQYLCCILENDQSQLGQNINPSKRTQERNIPKATQITIESIALDLLGDNANYHNIFQQNEELTFQVSFNTFLFEKLSLTEELILEICFGHDQEQSFRSDPFKPEANGSATVLIQQNFEIECQFKDLSSSFCTICLYKQFELDRPTSKIIIDYYALAICPQHCEFELKSLKTDRVLGRLIFDIEFQQLKELQIILKDLKCKVDGKEERAFYATFKAITSSETEVSKETQTIFGEFNKSKNKTVFHWGIAMDLYEDPTVDINVTMNNLKQATIQLCLYQDQEFQRRGSSRRHSNNSDDEFIEDTGGSATPSPKRVIGFPKLEKHLSDFSQISRKRTNQVNFTQDKPVIRQKNSLQKNKTVKEKMTRRSSLRDVMTHFNLNHNTYNDDSEESEDEFLTDLAGECYIGFQKLLRTEMRLFDRRDSFIMKTSMSISRRQGSVLDLGKSGDHGGSFNTRLASTRNPPGRGESNEFSVAQQVGRQQIKKFTEKISVAGKYIGEISGSFKFSNTPVLQQMGLGVLTDKGIFMTSAPVLTDSDVSLLGFKRTKTNSKIKDLQAKTKRLKELDLLKGKKFNKNQVEKERILSEIIQLLQQTEQIHRKMFYYENQPDLINAQQTLIELGFHCFLYSNNVKYEQRHYYYSILISIFDRGELKLPSLGFMEDQECSDELREASGMKTKHDTNQVQVKAERVKLANFYQKLLFTLVDDAVNKFCRKGVEVYLRNYVEKFISIGFFRIPSFRKAFVESILKKSDEKIDEWTNMSWNIDSVEEEGYEATASQYYDWDTYFYNQIPDSPEKKEANLIQTRIIYGSKWPAKLEKRTIAFFEIINKVVDYMHDSIATYNQKSNNLFWQDIPGYNQVLRAFLLELKALNIQDYPDSLIEASKTFLNNSQLLSVFVTILFKKTNVFDANQMVITFDLITKWMQEIEKKQEPFPSNFDFNFFIMGLTISLERIDHNVATTKVLWFLYKCLQFLPLEQRLNIIHEFIRKYFYKFFFHWSYNIRFIFYMLILYQIEYNLVIQLTKKLYVTGTMKKSFGSLTRILEEYNGDDSEKHVKELRKQFTSNIENYIAEIEQLYLKKGIKSDQPLKDEEDDFFEMNKEFNFAGRSSVGGKQRPRQKSSSKLDQTRSVQKLISIHKQLKTKLEEVRFLQDYLKKRTTGNSKKVNNAQTILEESEEEYQFDDDIEPEKTMKKRNSIQSIEELIIEDTSSNGDASFPSSDFGKIISKEEKDQMRFYRIMNKIPDELKVYVQEQVFKQFQETLTDYEKWKRESLKDERNHVLPDINVDNQVPLDDFNEETKAKEY